MARTWLWQNGKSYTLYLDDPRTHGDQLIFKIKGDYTSPARLRSTGQEVEGVDLIEFDDEFCRIKFNDEIMTFQWEEPTQPRENLIAQGVRTGPKIHVTELF